MKVAEVECSSRSRRSTHRVPRTGSRYIFRSGKSTDVESLEDARYFDGNSSYTVDWTARGRFMSKLAGENASVVEALEGFSYRAKQELAKAFGINANQTSAELTEELAEVGEELKSEMEAY